jgi:hypothetical protein
MRKPAVHAARFFGLVIGKTAGGWAKLKLQLPAILP